MASTQVEERMKVENFDALDAVDSGDAGNRAGGSVEEGGEVS